MQFVYNGLVYNIYWAGAPDILAYPYVHLVLYGGNIQGTEEQVGTLNDYEALEAMLDPHQIVSKLKQLGFKSFNNKRGSSR